MNKKINIPEWEKLFDLNFPHIHYNCEGKHDLGPDSCGEHIKSFLRQALLSAVQGKRERIIKLLPPEKPEKAIGMHKDTTELMLICRANGYNTYRREVLQALNKS